MNRIHNSLVGYSAKQDRQRNSKQNEASSTETTRDHSTHHDELSWHFSLARYIQVGLVFALAFTHQGVKRFLDICNLLHNLRY